MLPFICMNKKLYDQRWKYFSDSRIDDQYNVEKPQVMLRNGERVVTDSAMTIQYIHAVNYWITNVAALLTISISSLKGHAFWAAYLLPLCPLLAALILIFYGHNIFGCSTQNPTFTLLTSTSEAPPHERQFIEFIECSFVRRETRLPNPCIYTEVSSRQVRKGYSME